MDDRTDTMREDAIRADQKKNPDDRVGHLLRWLDAERAIIRELCESDAACGSAVGDEEIAAFERYERAWIVARTSLTQRMRNGA